MAYEEQDILIYFPGRQKSTASEAVGNHCSNYCAETEALMQTFSIIQAAHADFKQIAFLSDTRLYPAGISFQWAPEPGQSPIVSCWSGFQPTVDSQKRNSGCPCKGGCQRKAWQQCQLHQEEHHYQNAHDTMGTEGWLPLACLGASCSGEALYWTLQFEQSYGP